MILFYQFDFLQSGNLLCVQNSQISVLRQNVYLILRSNAL